MYLYRESHFIHFFSLHVFFLFFFFHDTATTEIYTLSLHDALRSRPEALGEPHPARPHLLREPLQGSHHLLRVEQDRKSTRLNSSHANISYAVFCLKKKKKKKKENTQTKKTTTTIYHNHRSDYTQT